MKKFKAKAGAAAPQADYNRPDVAAAMAQMERGGAKYARDRVKRKPQTAEQRARYNRRRRLKAVGREIDALASQVEQLHNDRSGDARFTWPMTAPPADNSDLRSKSPTVAGLLDSWERIEKEAAEGCEECAAFVVEWGPVLALALHMRHERPPERADDYDPSEVLKAPRQRYRRA